MLSRKGSSRVKNLTVQNLWKSVNNALLHTAKSEDIHIHAVLFLTELLGINLTVHKSIWKMFSDSSQAQTAQMFDTEVLFAVAFSCSDMRNALLIVSSEMVYYEKSSNYSNAEAKKPHNIDTSKIIFRNSSSALNCAAHFWIYWTNINGYSNGMKNVWQHGKASKQFDLEGFRLGEILNKPLF